MAGTSFPSLTSGRPARAADVTARTDWVQGHIVPMNAGSTTTGIYDLGTTTAQWANGYFSGKIAVGGLALSTPGANTLYADNIPKAWVNFDGTGTIAIKQDFNIASLTDNGTGNYTITFATPLTNASCVVCGAGYGTNQLLCVPHTASAFSITGVSVNFITDAGNVQDGSLCTVLIMGQQ